MRLRYPLPIVLEHKEVDVGGGSRRKANDGRRRELAKLSVAELDTGDEYYFKRFTATLFLGAVMQDFPAVRTQLESCPFGPFRHAKLNSTRFVQWMVQWARRNRIESNVVIAVAAESFAYWKDDGAHGPLPVRCTLHPQTIEIEMPPLQPFEPLNETRAAWSARVNDWTDLVIAEHLKHGCKRARPMKTVPSHYHWLARRTVGRETVAAIALDMKRRVTKSDDGDPGEFRPTVNDAISRLAKALELSLR